MHVVQICDGDHHAAADIVSDNFKGVKEGIEKMIQDNKKH
jgi:hypothetical protein